MEGEIWKSIPDTNYQVSTYGNIRNLTTGKILKINKDSCGYSQVVLYTKNGRKTCLVHRLVANAFIDNSQHLPEVDHINRNKSDNKLENLKWCDRSKNMLNTEHRNSDMFGIVRRSDRDCYRIFIEIDGKKTCIGSRKTIEEAIALKTVWFKNEKRIIK